MEGAQAALQEEHRASAFTLHQRESTLGPGSVRYLRLDVYLGSLADEQSGHVGVALLRGQVQRCDALLGQDVGLGAVLQQHRSDFHLVLLGRDVERSVAVLVDAGKERNTGVSAGGH